MSDSEFVIAAKPEDSISVVHLTSGISGSVGWDNFSNGIFPVTL